MKSNGVPQRNAGRHHRGLPVFSSDFPFRAYVGVKVLLLLRESSSVSLAPYRSGITRVTAKSRRVEMEAMCLQPDKCGLYGFAIYSILF